MSERDAADRRGAIRQVAEDSMFGCMGGDVTCQQEFPTDPSEWCGDCILTAFIAQADADAATIAQLRTTLEDARARLTPTPDAEARAAIRQRLWPDDPNQP